MHLWRIISLRSYSVCWNFSRNSRTLCSSLIPKSSSEREPEIQVLLLNLLDPVRFCSCYFIISLKSFDLEVRKSACHSFCSESEQFLFRFWKSKRKPYKGLYLRIGNPNVSCFLVFDSKISNQKNISTWTTTEFPGSEHFLKLFRFIVSSPDTTI